MKAASLSEEIAAKLQNTKEQKQVVGPLVQLLVNLGWKLEQIIFGKSEWRVPKSPSEATKREKNQSFKGFPVDIAVFDSPKNVGDHRHLIFMIECKHSTEEAGLTQLESYFVGEPHSVLGVWANSNESASQGAFVYRLADGRMLVKRYPLSKLPKPGEKIQPENQQITFKDLIQPSEAIFRKVISDLLDKVVTKDNHVTRREEQLDQLCNLLLLKLESDKQAKNDPDSSVLFRPMHSNKETANHIRDQFESFVDLYPETFTTEQDRKLRFSNDTIAYCVESLATLRLLDIGVASVSMAFQVLRSEALKQGEGQYFTPDAVIEAGVRLMQIKQSDLVIDPACGTGGFLVRTVLEMRRRFPNMTDEGLSKWAQTHIFGIEKDAIGLKLTKAVMQIAGDGSAHCARGDSVRTNNWATEFPHLNSGTFKNGRFNVVLTNPPFGKNLKVSAKDSRLSQLTIAKTTDDTYNDLEIGLLFLQRAYQLVKKGGKIGIVLPETYFFSPGYEFLLDWIKPRLRPIVVANIPMEAFQGFCRAKTNFYVFEKISTKD